MFDVNAMFAGAQEGGARLNFLKPGEGQVLAFANLVDYSKQGQEAPKYRADFVVLQSTAHAPGEVVSLVFHPYSTKFQGAGAKEAGNLQKMLKGIHGLPPDSPPELMGEVFTRSMDPSQPARGMVVKVDCWSRTTQGGATITDQAWTHIEGQTPDKVATNRAKIDTMPEFQPDNKGPGFGAPQAQPQQTVAQPPQTVMPPGVPAGVMPQMAQQPPAAPQAVPQAMPGAPATGGNTGGNTGGFSW